MKTLTEQVACLKCELAMRQRVYPQWIQKQKMSAEKAEHEIACIEACLATVDKVRMLEEVSEEMKQLALTKLEVEG